MAPGIGGNGTGPRQTGTVPKTKSHNEASREYNGAMRRDYHPFNHVHMPNNLSSLDWQPVNESVSHPRTRKESNTSASRFSESFDAENDLVASESLWFNTGQRNQAYNSDDDEVSQASWAENGYKSNNLGLPDKTQVASRLHQIRDYVNQTVTMMEGLRATGGQRNMAQHEKLSAMLEGLRDSELKLQTLYERLHRMPVAPKGEAENFPSLQMAEAPRERANKPVASSSKATETTMKNELKKQVQISQLKLQELQEQQATLKALKQKAQEQLNEARAAQGALMAAHGVTQAAANTDNMIQDRLHNLQRFFDTRQQIAQMAGLEDEEVESAEVQNKLDELQAKKQHMDQLLAQFSNLHTNNVADELTPEECERDVQNKMAELSVMKEILNTLQNSSSHVRPHTPQEKTVKKESRAGSVEKSNAPTSQALHAKTQQLNEAKAKLQQLQNLLHTVEELRSCGQPIPESVLRLMNGSEHSSSPTHQDRSDMSSQDLNVSQGPSERLVNSCERGELLERSCRSLNSCERERVKQQPAANTVKHNNQEGKVGLKIQLEELIRNQDLNLPQPLQSSSFQENGTTIGTWGGSTQSTLDEGYNPDYSGDLTESASVKYAPGTFQPPTSGSWRKPSTGSTSRISWPPPYVRQEVPRGAERPEPPCPPPDIPPQPDSHWVVHQISQLQNQLQQMSGLYKNFVEKQQNCPPAWLAPPNISAALGPYCQYIASTSQWQQQQQLVHSLNQCCQLIWHQQRELATLKETLSQLHQPVPEAAQSSPQQQAEASSTPPSNLGRAHNHVTLKPSLSSGPALAPPAVFLSAHSLPNLASPQSPPSPPPVNNRNLLTSPTATVLSLPPSLNNANPPNPNIFFNPQSQFTDPNFINLYPPYGNNLNFEFPSPVNFFPNPPEPFLAFHPQPQPATTLNNQVPPGNRANNYWDNFRSYSRQNLLSNSVKSNEGLPQSQRTPMERFLNTDTAGPSGCQPPPPRSRKERIVGGEVNQLVTRAQVHQGDEGEGEASGYQYNLALPPHGRQQAFSPHINTYTENEGGSVRGGNECERSGRLGARLVNDCEAPRGANKKPSYSLEHCTLPSSGNKRNFVDVPSREAKMPQLNNYHTEPTEQSNTEADGGSRAINLPRRHPRNINSICDNSNNLQQQQNCIGDGYCLMASDKGVRRKDNRGNVTKDCKAEYNGGGDSLEECVYSEVAALISVNEWRPQYLLQLFKDLRLLSSCPDPGMQATLSSTIHALASRTSQDEHREAVGLIEESTGSQSIAAATEYLSNFPHQPQPRNWSQKEVSAPPPPPPPVPQLPSNCAKLDWEVRSVLVEMLPFIKSQVGEMCGPALLESVRKLILHLVPTQATQDQLDAQLEDALHKFHGCRLGDVYEELLTVVADVLISELTFLRLVNTVHHNHSTEPQNGEVLQEGEEEDEDEEGAVGGAVGEVLSPSLLNLHPVNQARRNKSEPVSEADLAEADQSRHTVSSGGDEERGDTAEGIDQLEEEASGRDLSMANCNGNVATESKTEASWAVEQDRELGLDQVPTRLYNETEPEASLLSPSHPGVSDPGSSI